MITLSYDSIYDLALRRFGGDKQGLEAALPKPATPDELRAITDAQYLSVITRRVFQAGMKHSVINERWDNFEKAFNGFDVSHCAMLSPDDIESFMQDASLIRHRRKLSSIPKNAAMILDVRANAGSMGNFIADHPVHRIVELWIYLKRHGAQLGGMSGARVCRMIGKDTFLLTEDNVTMLMNHELVDRPPQSQGDWRRVQKLFVDWATESGRSLSEVSRMLSYGIQS